MKALILRGIPGAGKTHLLREGINHKNVFAVSADDYFIHYDSTVMREVYKFDRAKAGEAHAECFRRYLDAVSSYPTSAKERPQKLIVVSNTNIKSYEIAPYMLAAQAYTIDAAIFTILTEPEVCIQRNVHGVPPELIMKMHEALMREELPPWWKHLASSEELLTWINGGAS